MIEERIDKIISKLFPEITRSKVQALISKGKIFYKLQGDWLQVTKPGQKLSVTSFEDIQWKFEEDEELKYVSRGALKLKAAVEKFKIDIKEKLCLDIGLSTGGFSDYLLQNGAKKILGIDVGREQLHQSLRDEPRLIWRDKINAREVLAPEILDSFFEEEKQNFFDLIVIDISFISLEKIINHLRTYIKDRGVVIALVKPQFELTRSDLNKKGVVKDSARIPEVIEKISRVFKENKLELIDECVSPIEGDHGNKEVLVLAKPINSNP